MPVHDDIPGLDIFLAFFEGKRVQVYSVGETIIQSALVMDDFVQHPGCYRTADDQQDVLDELDDDEITEEKYWILGRIININNDCIIVCSTYNTARIVTADYFTCK